MLPPAFGHFTPSPVEVNMPLIRQYEQLRKAMKVRPVSPTTLESFEEIFNSISQAMPEALQPHSNAYLDPYMYRVTMALPNARIMLHRQNLSPLCSPEECRAALHACAAAAQLSVRLIQRSLQQPPNVPTPFTETARAALSWDLRVRSSTPSLVCTHLWRCILVLALSLDFNAALTCVRVSAAIADLRKINIACARYLTFFLERLTDRVRAGHGTKHMLERDEEMLAYASGDLQEDSKGSWIWSDDAESPSRELGAQGFYTASSTPQEDSPTDMPPDSAIGHGGEWNRVESLLLALRHEQQRQRPLPEFQQGRSMSTNSMAASEVAGRNMTTTPTLGSNTFTPGSGSGGGGNERMNIANII